VPQDFLDQLAPLFRGDVLRDGRNEILGGEDLEVSLGPGV
jgi:hypothetical protein